MGHQGVSPDLLADYAIKNVTGQAGLLTLTDIRTMPHQITKNTIHQGFTLVEISIILIIIGLLAGGVTVGQRILKQTKLRAVIQEVYEFENAFNVFKTKYHGYPGDISDASSYWAAASNGNGNRVLTTTEGQYAWEHLVLADLWKVKGVANYDGTQIGHSNYEDGRFAIYHATDVFSRTGHQLEVGRIEGTQCCASNALFSPEEANSIDLKMDDGIASRGSLFATDGDDVSSTADCSQISSHSGSSGGNPIDYNFSFTEDSCRLHYWFAGG